MPVHLVRGMKRPWRTNYSEDKGGVTQTATNKPVCSGFSFPWTVFRVVSVKRKSSLAQKVQLGGCPPCCVPVSLPFPDRWKWYTWLLALTYLFSAPRNLPLYPLLSLSSSLYLWPPPQPESLSWLSIGNTTASLALLTQVARGQSFIMKRFSEIHSTSAPSKLL